MRKRILLIAVVLMTACMVLAACGDEEGDGNQYIGDTVKSESLEFTVNSVDNKKLLGSELVGVSTDNNFIVINLTIKNTGNSEASLLSSYFKVVKGSSTYEVNSGSMYLTDGFVIAVAVGAGVSKTINMAFETPTTSSTDTYTLNVQGDMFATKKSIILTNG